MDRLTLKQIATIIGKPYGTIHQVLDEIEQNKLTAVQLVSVLNEVTEHYTLFSDEIIRACKAALHNKLN